ncbi:hypothetical protein MKW94_009763, partial [Papaver nudicaule]|nr:hypothetical protein [Papaver nudicaule]
MAAYSYLHPALFLDSANYLIQNNSATNHHNPVTMMSTGSFQEQACQDVVNSNTTSLSYYPSADNCQTLQDVVQFHERSNCEEKNSRSSSDNEQSLITTTTTNDSNSTHSSSLVGIHNNNNPKTTEKKRKNSATSKSKTSREGSCISSGESK